MTINLKANLDDIAQQENPSKPALLYHLICHLLENTVYLDNFKVKYEQARIAKNIRDAVANSDKGESECLFELSEAELDCIKSLIGMQVPKIVKAGWDALGVSPL